MIKNNQISNKLNFHHTYQVFITILVHIEKPKNLIYLVISKNFNFYNSFY